MADPINDLYQELKRRGKTNKSFEEWNAIYGDNPRRQELLYKKMKDDGYINETTLDQFTGHYFGKKKSSPDLTNLGPLGGEGGSMPSGSTPTSSEASAPTATEVSDTVPGEEGEPVSIFDKARKAIEKLHEDNLDKANQLNPVFGRIEGNNWESRNAVDIQYDNLSTDAQARLDMLAFDEKTQRLKGKESDTSVPAPVPGGGNPLTKWINAKIYDYVFRDLSQEKLSDMTRPAWANMNPTTKAYYDKQEAVQKSTRRFNFELNTVSTDQKNVIQGIRYLEGKVKEEFGDGVFEEYKADTDKLDALFKDKEISKLPDKEKDALKRQYEDYERKWGSFINSDNFMKLNRMNIIYGENRKKFKEISEADEYEYVRELMDVKESLQKAADEEHRNSSWFSTATLNRVKDNWIRATGKTLFKGVGALLDGAENIIGDDQVGAWDEFTNQLMTLGDAAAEYNPQSTYINRPFETQTKTIEYNGKTYMIDDGEAVRDQDGYLVDSQEAYDVLQNEDKHRVISDRKRIGTQGFTGKTGQLFADIGMLMMTARLGGAGLQTVGMGETAASRIAFTSAATAQVAGPLYDESLAIFGDTAEGRRKAGAFTLTTSTAIGAINLLFGGEMFGGMKGLMDDVVSFIPKAISPLSAKLAAGKTTELSVGEVSRIVVNSFFKQGREEVFEEFGELGIEALSKLVTEYATGAKFDPVITSSSLVETTIMAYAGGAILGAGNIGANVNHMQRDAWYNAAQNPEQFKSALTALKDGGYDVDQKMIDDLTRMSERLNKKSNFLGDKVFRKNFDKVYELEVARYQAEQAKEAGLNDMAKKWETKAQELEAELGNLMDGYQEEEAAPVPENPINTEQFNQKVEGLKTQLEAAEQALKENNTPENQQAVDDLKAQIKENMIDLAKSYINEIGVDDQDVKSERDRLLLEKQKGMENVKLLESKALDAHIEAIRKNTPENRKAREEARRNYEAAVAQLNEFDNLEKALMEYVYQRDSNQGPTPTVPNASPNIQWNVDPNAPAPQTRSTPDNTPPTPVVPTGNPDVESEVDDATRQQMRGIGPSSSRGVNPQPAFTANTNRIGQGTQTTTPTQGNINPRNVANEQAGIPIDGTPQDVPNGTFVNYQGTQGFLIQNEDGTTEVQTLQGDRILVESSQSGKTNEELGLRLAPNVQLSPEEMVKVEQDPNAAVDTQQVAFNGENNTVTIHGNQYTYDGVQTDANGNTTAIRVIDESGKRKYIRSKDAVTEIEIQKALYERGTNITSEQVQSKANELGIKPTNETGTGGTSTTSNVQPTGPVANNQGVEPTTVANSPNGEGGGPDTPSPSPTAEAAPTPKIENVERGLKKVTIGDQVFTLRRDSDFEADRPNGWFLRAGENVDPAGEVLGEFRNLQEAKDGIPGLNLTGQSNTNTQQEGESGSQDVKTPQKKRSEKEAKELKEAQDVFKNLAKGDISHEGAIGILEKNGQEVPFALHVGAFMDDPALMEDPDTRDNMARALEKYGDDLAYDIQQGIIDPITAVKAYNELGIVPPNSVTQQIGKKVDPPQGSPLFSKADKAAKEKQAQIRKETGIDKIGEKNMNSIKEQIEAIDQAIADIEMKMTQEQLANRYNMNAGIPLNMKLFNLHVLRAYHMMRRGVLKFTDFLNNIREGFSNWWATVWHAAKEINLNMDKYNDPSSFGRIDKLLRLLQDKDRFVYRMREMYKRAGIPVPGTMDFYTKKQLEKSKAEFEIQLVREEILGKNKGELGYKKSRKNSLVGRVLDATGYSVDQFNDFLYALHAKQYNARARALQRKRQRDIIDALQKKIEKARDDMAIRQMAGLKSDKTQSIENWQKMIDKVLEEPIIDDASGMTDAEADAITAQAQADGVHADLMNFAQEFHEKVTKRIPQELYRGSLIDAETRDKLLNGESETGVKFDYYVPLMVKKEAYDAKHEMDFSILDHATDPNVVKMMMPTGDFRVEQREPPLFSSLVKLHQSISQAEQNLTKVALADMVIDDVETSKNNGTNTVQKYEVIPTVKVPSLNMMGEPVMFTEIIHPGHDSEYNEVSIKDLQDNSIPVKMNGETKYIFFRPVQDKNGDPQIHPVVRSFKKNPQKIDENIKAGMQIMRAAVGVYRLMLTTWYPDFAIANFVRDFQDAIVMVNRFREDKNGAKLMKDIAMAVPNAAKVMFKSPWLDPKDPMAKDLMEAYRAGMKVSWTNYEGVEKEIQKLNNFRYDGPLKVGFSWVANRLGYLSDATEGIMRLATYNAMRKNGVDIQEAANIAKNITINFETKGTAGPYLNTAFLFLNAGIQGAANSVRLLKSGRGRKFIAASVGMGMMMRALSNMLAGDDEEWLAYKNNDLLATYNTLIYNPLTGGVIKIPKPYSVFRVATWFGESAVDLFTGDMNQTDITVQGIQQLLAVFDPYGGGVEDPSKFFVPTIVLPLIQLQFNKTWYGTEAYRFNEDKGVPDYLQYNASTIGKGLGFEDTPLFYPYTDLAEDLNDMGIADMSPTTYEYLVDRYITGAPKFLNNIMQTANNIGQGKFEFKDAPIIRRFYTQLTEDERLNLYNLYQVLDAPYSTEFTPKQQDNMVRFLSRIYDKKVLPEDTYWKIFDSIYEKGFMFPKDREYYRKMENEFKDYEYLRDKERLKEEQERIKHFK